MTLIVFILGLLATPALAVRNRETTELEQLEEAMDRAALAQNSESSELEATERHTRELPAGADAAGAPASDEGMATGNREATESSTLELPDVADAAGAPAHDEEMAAGNREATESSALELPDVADAAGAPANDEEMAAGNLEATESSALELPDGADAVGAPANDEEMAAGNREATESSALEHPDGADAVGAPANDEEMAAGNREIVVESAGDPLAHAAALVQGQAETSACGGPGRCCCCWMQPCSYAMEMRYGTMIFNRNLNESEFNPGWTEIVAACCFGSSQLGRFESCPGAWLANQECRVEFAAGEGSTVDACKTRLSRWFSASAWYTVLREFAGDERSSLAYEAYIPCLVSKQSHVHEVCLSELSFFESTGRNEVKYTIQGFSECASLSLPKLRVAIEQSYDDMCPLAVLDDGYKPNFRPETACSYNKSASQLHFPQGTSCPEGHRCACPVNGKDDIDAVDTQFTSSKEDKNMLQRWLAKLSSGYIGALSWVITTGTLAAVGHWLFTWSWPLYYTASGAGLVVFGANTLVKYLRHSCQAAAGCYPMECMMEPDVGCRISFAEDDLEDVRNPYWFLPPPMYKCAVSTWGKCKLSACTSEDVRRQRVGERKVMFGYWTKQMTSTVFNCQPTLAKDMDFARIRVFESKVSELRGEEERTQRRAKILQDRHHHHCPFLKTTKMWSQVECFDGTFCSAPNSTDSNCCYPHQGVKHCSLGYPKLCADNLCDGEVSNCRGTRGGLKACAVEDRCSFLLPTLVDDHVECKNGQSYPTDSFFKDVVDPNTELIVTRELNWCGNQGGVERCPWNHPKMCVWTNCTRSSGAPSTGQCCDADCTSYGGPKACNEIETPGRAPLFVRSGAVGARLLWQPLAALLSLVLAALAAR